MRLTKEGIVDEEWESEETDRFLKRPQTAAALLGYWHATLTGIAEDYTFGDLVSLLRGVDDIEMISPLLSCDLAAFLADADGPRHRDDDERLQFVQVRNVTARTHYEEDPAQPDEHVRLMDDEEAAEQDRVDAGIAAITGERKPYRLVDATGDDPITGEPVFRRLRAPAMHGRWQPPYDLSREFAGWGKWKEPYDGYFEQHPEIDPERYEGAFALELTPLSALLELPLRYDPSVQFWSGHSTGDGALLLDTQLTITLGEFLHAIFWEVGFHGSPSRRDEARAFLRERVESIDRLEGGDET